MDDIARASGVTNEVTTMIANHIEVEKKTKYGSEYIYPLCEQAQNFCRLLNGQKTLTPANIEGIKRLGYMVWAMVPTDSGAIKVGEL